MRLAPPIPRRSWIRGCTCGLALIAMQGLVIASLAADDFTPLQVRCRTGCLAKMKCKIIPGDGLAGCIESCESSSRPSADDVGIAFAYMELTRARDFDAICKDVDRQYRALHTQPAPAATSPAAPELLPSLPPSGPDGKARATSAETALSDWRRARRDAFLESAPSDPTSAKTHPISSERLPADARASQDQLGAKTLGKIEQDVQNAADMRRDGERLLVEPKPERVQADTCVYEPTLAPDQIAMEAKRRAAIEAVTRFEPRLRATSTDTAALLHDARYGMGRSPGLTSIECVSVTGFVYRFELDEALERSRSSGAVSDASPSVIGSEVSATSAARTKGLRFAVVGDGTVVDTQTNLMWADHDNGLGITWFDAKRYAESYHAGGYADWRLPTTNELRTLYAAGVPSRPACFTPSDSWVTRSPPGIRISCDWLWAAETFRHKDGHDVDTAYVDFIEGRSFRSWLGKSDQFRVLPVRSLK